MSVCFSDYVIAPLATMHTSMQRPRYISTTIAGRYLAHTRIGYSFLPSVMTAQLTGCSPGVLRQLLG